MTDDNYFLTLFVNLLLPSSIYFISMVFTENGMSEAK